MKFIYRHSGRSLWLLLLILGVHAAAAESRPDATDPVPGETVFIPELRGVICVPDTTALAVPPPAGFAGVDTSRVPLLADPDAAALLGKFLGKPMSFGSLDRLCITLRTWLRVMGQPFVSVYAPPQEVTGGVIRLVVQPAKLDGEMRIDGAKWFSEQSYRAAVPLAAGAEIDALAIQGGLDRLNRNPYRRVVIAAEPGATTGTTRLVLRTQETRPWGFTTGYNNNGTAVTDENRASAGVTWGNAFGRGDTLGYNFTADPGLEHSLSHSANYSTTAASGRSLTFFGAHSTIESALPVPLTQAGTSWQIGARLGVPLGKSTDGWERSLGFSADFKYSDNNLEFATIPITDNVTHAAQFGATFSVSRRAKEKSLAFSASFYGSPGGLTSANEDEAYELSRPGARASYVYGRVEGQYSRTLPRGFSWSASASLQLASGPLLGPEQLNGGGSAAVRGYHESSAFGDEGALVNTELHLPAFQLFKQRDQADLFLFADGATLRNLGPGGDTTELASAGLGLNYQFGRHFSLRASYGWQFKKLANAAGGSSRGHLGASLSF